MRNRPLSAATPASQNQLGEFLRAKRDQLRPEDVGLPPGFRRRAPGLRREEVATLCHISPTWYTWIEQGRTQAVSTETLSAIATGLHLSNAERAYLFELAARADPEHPSAEHSAPHQLAELVKVIRTPAYILDRHWDAIAWNRPATLLFEDWLKGRGTRNLLRYVFLHPRAPSFIVDWPERAQRLVAEYRSDTAAWRDDPVRQALVDELRSASRAFDVAWRSQKVLSREGGRRAFEQARSGRREYEQFTLRVAQHPDLKLTVLVPGEGPG
ncbi:MAG: helix-turn-helix transcriptional regulator [Aquabacterium sp.]|uniref:helix-turn-helix transcriptional regulator n=1 Tax=Aquabacterium sp. TaxID=1872578 RepID=UPI0027191C18|nr:helix-turn-helix transcriptional regulator [Aquabacterium sp.]MDO9005619.1 helix-turn-helix transcriptional regulator [Aquabacterium sp.]